MAPAVKQFTVVIYCHFRIIQSFFYNNSSVIYPKMEVNYGGI